MHQRAFTGVYHLKGKAVDVAMHPDSFQVERTFDNGVQTVLVNGQRMLCVDVGKTCFCSLNEEACYSSATNANQPHSVHFRSSGSTTNRF